MYADIQPQWTLDQTQPIASQIHRILRERVIRGDLPPGNQRSETEIAKRDAKSRQPVREAFIKLAAEGLLSVRPQRGTVVAVGPGRVENGTKIFGPRPKEALEHYRNGMNKEQLLAETGHTLGLADVSLSIEKGEIFVIMGLSGSGKSTMIRHFNRLIEPTAGRILVNGEDVLRFSGRGLENLRRRTMSMVFQRFGLMPHRTVLQNVGYGLAVRGTSQAERDAKAMEWIATVGLAGYEHQYPTQLSGGMQQRAAICRALMHDPDILLMDEPFGALDALTREEMSRGLLKIGERRPKTVLFVTHSIAESVLLSDRVVVMSPRPGRIVESITVPLERTNRIGMETSHDFQACAGHIRDLIFGNRQAAA